MQYWSLLEESKGKAGCRWFPSQRASKAESVSMTSHDQQELQAQRLFEHDEYT